MYNIENNMPKFMQRMVHVKRAIVKPNEETKSLPQKVGFALETTVRFGLFSFTCALHTRILVCLTFRNGRIDLAVQLRNCPNLKIVD